VLCVCDGDCEAACEQSGFGGFTASWCVVLQRHSGDNPCIGVDDNVPNVPPGFENVTHMVATGSTSTSVGRNKVKVRGYRYIVGVFSVQF
jgi:hypothetical protein